MNDNLATRIAVKVVNRKVSIPTWVVLYINVLIGLFVVNSVYLKHTEEFNNVTPLEGKVWPLLLLVASLTTLYGLAGRSSKAAALGAFLGSLSWIMALLSWVLIGGVSGSYVVPLLTLPMIAFFAFTYLKHSIIERWANGKGEE